MSFFVRIDPVDVVWREFIRTLLRIRGMRRELFLAMAAVGRLLLKQTQLGILRGAPGGVPLRANAPATIAKKGSSRPLIDTGTLLRTITTITYRRGAFVVTEVGVPRNVRHADPRRTVARVGAFHEFGFWHANAGRFLQRPFLRPVLVREAPRIISTFSAVFGRALARRLRFFGPLRPPTAGGRFVG